MKPQRCLVIFAKAPRLGAVKRRLGKDIGDVTATAFYRQCTATLIRRLSADRRWRLLLAVTPDRDAPAAFWPVALPRIRQGGGDLGERMARALATPSSGPVVIIGSDIPGIQARHVADAFRRLGDHDAVLGPAADGGYWLIGLRRRPTFRLSFAGVRWSGPHALADTVAALKGQRVAIIERLEDVDDGASYRRWREATAGQRSSCS